MPGAVDTTLPPQREVESVGEEDRRARTSRDCCEKGSPCFLAQFLPGAPGERSGAGLGLGCWRAKAAPDDQAGGDLNTFSALLPASRLQHQLRTMAQPGLTETRWHGCLCGEPGGSAQVGVGEEAPSQGWGGWQRRRLCFRPVPLPT